jgi:penicillin G amidase
VPGLTQSLEMTARMTKATVGPAAVLAAAGAGLGLWYQLLRRPLPKTSGRLRLRGLDAPVEVLRDRFGVPHIRARSATDACFALGFCHGQDRLWQLEFFRRATAGRLAEFAGADALGADLLMRTLGMRRVAEREERELSTLLRAFLDAYTAGINGAIDCAPALPIEFQLVRVESEPWTAVDLLAASKLMAFGLSTNWELELLRAQLVRIAGAERAERLEPQYPRANPIVTAPGLLYAGRGNDLAAQIERVRETLGLSVPAGGSNNWVVSGARSVTGRPLLACDPHLTTTIPDLWYEADLSCDEFRVRGATLPTNPFPVFGQTAATAWGFTNVMADTQDLFVERLNADDARLYEFEGDWRRAEVVREEVTVKGRGRPETIDVTITHHGPIVNAPLGAHDEQPLALSWTGLQYPCITESGYRTMLAQSADEVAEATEDHAVPPLNMLFADRDGNIGYQLAGKIPIRRGGCPDLPKPGWTGEFEWDGTVPYDELPRLSNPPEGFIVTANNRIVDDDYPYHITSEWMTGYRARRIEEMLGERERHSLRDFERMQLDFYSYPGVDTVQRLSRLHPRSQREVRAIERLKSWDGHLDARTIAGTIYHAFTVVFAQTVVRAAVPDETLVERYLNKSGVALFAVVSSPWRFQARMIELWDEGDPAWFASSERPEGRPWDDVALEALEAALDGLEERYGRDPDRWRWGRVHGVEFVHPFGAANPVFRRIFNRSVETGGASETVTQNGYLASDPFKGVWGPVYRMLVDLGDRRRSRWQLTTGQSGHPGSRHYDDMLEGWRDGHTNPVYFDEHELRAAGGAKQLRLDPDY